MTFAVTFAVTMIVLWTCALTASASGECPPYGAGDCVPPLETTTSSAPESTTSTTIRGGDLPFTGGDVAALTAYGLALAGAGTFLVRRSRR